jgi:nicotinate phosphoribosyltransferase
VTVGRALLTDLYELRMAASFRRRGMNASATFSLFMRALPPERGFLVACGLDSCLDYLEGLAVDDDDLDALTGLGLDELTVEALAGLRFTGDVWAVPEGRVVFAGEPLLEVTAPIAEGQFVETYLLNQLTFATTIASKAARCRIAAGDAGLVDFAFRRTHGGEAAMTVARASAIVGFSATSNVEAARRFGLRAVGTMAHSYVEAFASEEEAFRAFAEDSPAATVLLVDTYDTGIGVQRAIEVIAQLGLGATAGIRIDSGDLAASALDARRMLDAAGLTQTQIFASGGLDEYAIAALVAEGAPIDSYGVGTNMGVSADAPTLESVYKLVEFDGRPVMKLSTAKASTPGPKQVFRGAEVDVIGLRDETPPADTDALLVPVMERGRRIHRESIVEARQRFESDLRLLPPACLRTRDVSPRPVRLSPAAEALTTQVHQELIGRDQASEV